MARAIGLEIKKCMTWKTEHDSAELKKNVDENEILDR